MISICLPSLNGRSFLKDRLNSIMAQTLTDWELIVCDSYSDDGSWEFLQQFADDGRIRLYQVPRAGLYAGWNECLKRCRGEYVYIATVDDTCEATFLEKMVGALEKRGVLGSSSLVLGREMGEGGRAEGGRLKVEKRDQTGGNRGSREKEWALRKSVVSGQKEVENQEPPDQGPGTKDQGLGTKDQGPGTKDQGHIRRPVDIAVCGFDVIDDAGEVLPDHSAARWPKQFYGEWLNTQHIRDGRTEFILHACLGIVWWTVSSVVFRKSLLDRIGLFRMDRGSQGDEEWEMRAALASDITYVPESLATWRVHGDQATGKLKDINRTNLDCFESVLNDDESGIPDEWKTIPKWKKKITHICRTEYLDSLGLYRNVLRQNPRAFLAGVKEAAMNAPGFLLTQAMRGFSWFPQMSPDPIDAAHKLIEMFDCKWPPQRAEQRGGDLNRSKQR